MAAAPSFDTTEVARLRRVIVRLARMLNASASDEGLTPTQASVLAIVAARGPVGLAEVAEVEGLNPTMLSRIVGKLDSAGLIRRQPDPADQRAAHVEPTELGREASERVRALQTQQVTRILAGLPAEVTTALLAALPALETLASGLRENETAGSPKSG